MLEELGKARLGGRATKDELGGIRYFEHCTERPLDEIIKDIAERRRQTEADPPPLSAEEQAFFQSFEEQMGSGDETPTRLAEIPRVGTTRGTAACPDLVQVI
jgi:hypothetical protein